MFWVTRTKSWFNPSGMENPDLKDMEDHFPSKWSQTLGYPILLLRNISHSWANKREGRIHGLIVERGMEGLLLPLRPHNNGLYAHPPNRELIFDNVKSSQGKSD